MRGNTIEIKPISNGFVITHEGNETIGRSEYVEVYCKTIHEVNNFVSDYYSKDKLTIEEDK